MSSRLQTRITPQIMRLLLVLTGDMSREHLQRTLGLLDRKSFRERYLRPAQQHGLIEMTLPHAPSSHRQKYRLTDLGLQQLQKNTLKSEPTQLPHPHHLE